MTNITRRSLLQGVGAGVASIGPLRLAKAQSGPIKLPIMFSLSGPLSIIGQQAKHGAEITIKIINQNGGVLGRTIEPIFFDDKAQPNALISAAREAISMGFNYIGGGLVSSHFIGLQPLLTETKTVLLAGTGSAPAITNESFNRYLFPGSDNDIQRANILSKTSVDKFPDAKVFGSIMSEVQSYAQSYANFQAFAERDYAKIGKHPEFSSPRTAKIGTTDFRPLLSELVSSNIDTFYNFIVGADGVTFWSQARAFDLNTKLKAVIDQTMDIIALKALKQNIPPNLWTRAEWYHGQHNDSEMSRAFYKEYVAQTGDTLPSGYLYYGNVVVSGLAEAIKQTAGKTDADSIINALETNKFETIKGRQYYRKEDHLLIGEVDICHIIRSDDDTGIKVTEAVKYNTIDLSPPPNPGKPFKL